MPGQVYDCVVLGAGIAGVTAARDLQRAGMTVLLLEGSGRIGGRMWSRRDFVRGAGLDRAKFPLEAGAEYVHVSPFAGHYGEFFAELRKHGFSLGKFPKWGGLGPGGDGHNRVFFRGFEKPKTLVGTMMTDCPNIWDMHTIISDVGSYSGPDRAVGQYVAQRGFNGRGVAMARYALSAHTPGMLDGARDDISIRGLRSDWIPTQLMEESERRLEGAAGSTVKLVGFDALPRAIAAEFEGLLSRAGVPGEIRLGAVVDRVERGGPGLRVFVRGEAHAIETRSAICTFSVGVLDPVNGSGDAIFGPLLTARKRAALRVVRMGAITKFSLEFKQRMWPESEMTVLSFPEGDARTFFAPFPSEANGPHVLTGLIMGRDHERLRGLSDDQAWRHVFRVIEEILNPGQAASAWDPARVLVGSNAGGVFTPNFSRQDWEADPLFRGGNSYLAFEPGAGIGVESARLALKDASETAPLFWAGEATAPAHRARYQPLCVHGAYISGTGAGEEVWRYLKGVRPVTPPGLPKPRGRSAGIAGARAIGGAARTTIAVKPRKPARAVMPKVAAERVHLVRASLSAREFEALRRYALIYAKGDTNAAAADLLRVTLTQRVMERLVDSDAEVGRGKGKRAAQVKRKAVKKTAKSGTGKPKKRPGSSK